MARLEDDAELYKDVGGLPAKRVAVVETVGGGGGGGTSHTDDSAFTVGSTTFTPAGGIFQGTRDSVDDGDAGAFAMTALRALKAVLETETGDSVMDDTNDAVRVNIVAGSSSGTEYTEDDAAAANPVAGAQILVRQDTPGAITDTDGDNIARRGTNFGAAFSQILDSSGNFIDTFGGGTQYTEGDVDASITGTAAMMEVAADTLQPIQGTVADGLLVNLGSNNDITGTVTANSGTDLNTSALALESGGNLDTISGDTTSLDGKITACNTGDVQQSTHDNFNANANIQVGNADVTNSNPVPTEQATVTTLMQTYEDTSFVTGDSPVTMDFNTDLGQNAKSVIVINDGPGDFQVDYDVAGAGSYSDKHTMKSNEVFPLNGISIDTLRITWVSDSAYRVVAI